MTGMSIGYKTDYRTNSYISDKYDTGSNWDGVFSRNYQNNTCKDLTAGSLNAIYNLRNEYTTSATMLSDYYIPNTINATTTATSYWPFGADEEEIYFRSTWKPVVVSPGDRMRQMIRDRMAPAIHRSNKRQSLFIAMDVREERARQTLRRIIGEQSFRKFIRDGFITVVPKSGLTYRIYPGHGMTDVYDRGIMVDRLCVVLKGRFPPTDSLIMRYLLILNDEGEFSKYAIKHPVSNSTELVYPTKEEVRPLTEAWAKLKVA